MKFKELLEDITWEEIKESLEKLDVKNLEDYRNVYLNLLSLEPTETDTRLCIVWIPPDGKFVDDGYWDIHGRNGKLHKDTEDAELFPNVSEEFLNSEVTWALEFNKWCEFLGMEIDTETANNIELSRADIVAHILYEMTFIGYEEEEIQDKANELKEAVEEIKNMSEEELKKNCCNLEEFKERIQKKIDGLEMEKEDEEGEI